MSESLTLVELLQSGDAALQQGELARADSLLRKAIALQPDSVEALLLLGRVCRQRREHLQAIRWLKQLARLEPDNAECFNLLGECCIDAGLEKEGEAFFRKATTVDSRHTSAIQNLVDSFYRQGRDSDAATVLHRMNPNFMLERLRRKTDRLRTKSELTVQVVSASDFDDDQDRRLRWGDYWVKFELEKAFADAGKVVVSRNADVTVHLLGPIAKEGEDSIGIPGSGPLPESSLNLAWIYSHPNELSTAVLSRYDKLFCLSSSFIAHLNRAGFDAELLVGATSKTPVGTEVEHDIVFVGNYRPNLHKRTQILRALATLPYDLRVWGEGWENVLPTRCVGGLYFNNQDLGKLYSASRIALNDHTEDMRTEGFVSVRVFDILSCGGFAISDKNPGIEEIFGGTVPQYETVDDLIALVDHYLHHNEEREELSRKGQQLAIRYSFPQVARRFLGELDDHPSSPSISSSFLNDAKELVVLYVDAVSASQAACNVNGIIRAYSRIATLHSFDYRRRASECGQSSMNEMLLETACSLKPHVIHFGKSELVYGETVRRIKESIDTYVIHFYGDFRWDPQPWVVDIGRHTDCTLFNTTDPRILDRYREMGLKNLGGFWDAGTDPTVFYPRRVETLMDVLFMGNNITEVQNEGYEVRRNLLRAILQSGHDLHICGEGWDGFQNTHPFATEGDFATFCSASKITLGINGVNDVRMYASWRRTLNSMASGAFHLAHYVPGMETVFENHKHLVWFCSIPEALECIDHYLSHDDEREKIAEAGRKEVLASHTWDRRVKELIDRFRKHRGICAVKSAMAATTAANDPLTSIARASLNTGVSYQDKVDRAVYIENPEIDDDQIESMFGRWRNRQTILEHPQREIYEGIAARVQALSICDLGCGVGLGSVILAQKAARVLGVEKSAQCCAFARQCFPISNVSFHNADITNSALPEASFDVLVAIEVIEHVANCGLALEACRRLLKPGGQLFMSSPNRNARHVGKTRSLNKHHVREWTIAEFRDILSDYFGEIEFYDYSLSTQLGFSTKVSPVVAACRNTIAATHQSDTLADRWASGLKQREDAPATLYNLNFDDLLPCFADFSLLDRLIGIFPDIKITVFTPINSRGNNYSHLSNNMLDNPEWCERVRELPRANFEIAVHGYHHNLVDSGLTPEFKHLSREEAKRVIADCEGAFQHLGIEFSRGFRPPRWEMSRGCREALEELDYLYVSDTPRFFSQHRSIKIPRLFSNSDICAGEDYGEIAPYKELLYDTNNIYIHRGHLVSWCDNNLTSKTFSNIVRTINSFQRVEFVFLSDLARRMRDGLLAPSWEKVAVTQSRALE